MFSDSVASDSSVGKKKLMMLYLKASDNAIFEVPEDVAFQSNLFKKMVQDLRITDPDSPSLKEPLPITQCNGEVLEKILVWCTKHRGETFHPKDETEDQRTILTADDEEYLNVSSAELLKILLGANYLDIPGLLDIITQKIANLLIGKTVAEIREIYGIENDFTPEEEEEIRMRYEWIENDG